jgi:Ca2+-binding RTX toxin-like protein
MRTPTRTLAAVGTASLLVLTLPALEAQAATPLCWGKAATIVGTEGDDLLVGHDLVSDVIYGAGGNDRIMGAEDWYTSGKAPDFLCGGPGNDYVTGAGGPDKINGGDGDDRADGYRGADVVQGNAGHDTLIDDMFEDMDSANDILKGGIGNDHITAASGLDKIYGEAGDDTLIDSECSTTYLYGGPGADHFESYWTVGTYDCTPLKDYIDGNDGVDTAKASKLDAVTRVEYVTRYPEAS